MTLIKDLIDIPEKVHKGDFVLNLASGVVHPKQTLDTYVVNPQLLACFKDALGFIQSAMDAHASKAAYLHGSFGAGKSHFMAVLHLILQNQPDARVKPELSALFDKAPWIGSRKFLLVPYHMVGARSMESAVLGGYAAYVRKLHPSAPEPGVYLASALFDNAVTQRQQLGDAKFFEILNKDKGDSGWGALDEGWEAASFDRTIEASADDSDRIRLVGDLVTTHFPVVAQMARADGEQLVDFDQGLSIISRHAKELGYDGLILFLDELILWLASRAADLPFVHKEGSKLAKLVEATAERPAPIISFVARQRDLSELVGDGHTGLAELNFSDALKHWEGRFHKITLEDRNLPEIAEKRVLRPKSDAARREIDDAFKRIADLKENVMNVLLTGRGDTASFRKVYPFSPALVDTLVAVSSVLQRERTALKIMLELLVEQRDTLELGQLIPVGDLFDIISRGDEAFSDIRKDTLANARRLLYEKLLPLLEQTHGVRADVDAAELASDPDRRRSHERLVNDARLLKTLLLAAMVPEVESLKNLTAHKLAALNHGIIKVPVPGGEARVILNKLRTWAADVGEIKLTGDESSPVISLQLTGVDAEAIIRHAMAEDNGGNRLRKLRETLYAMLGIHPTDDPVVIKTMTWRSTPRSFQVVLGHVRDLSNDNCQAEGDSWRLLIDIPFDEGRSPQDANSRLDRYERDGLPSTRTIGWIPSYFSAAMQKDLGRLVVIDHIMKGELGQQHLTHLPPQDRETARHLLKNLQSALYGKLQDALRQAYGLGGDRKDVLEPSYELEGGEHYARLWSGFTPRPPVAEDLSDAMQRLMAQAFESQYPAHPEFKLSREVTPNDAKKLWLQFASGVADPDTRYAIDKGVKELLIGIAVPLKLIELGDTHFIVDRHWWTVFDRRMAEAHVSNVTVRQLYQWMEEPIPTGLPVILKNLVVLMYARRTHRTFFQFGAPKDVDAVDSLKADMELRLQALPDESLWPTAVERAAVLLPVAPARVRTTANVDALLAALQSWAGEHRTAGKALPGVLGELGKALMATNTGNGRLQTARQAQSVLEAIVGQDPLSDFVSKTDGLDLTVLKVSIQSAAEIVGWLDTDHLKVLQRLPSLPKSERSLAALNAGFLQEEQGTPLLGLLRSAHHEALQALLAVEPKKLDPIPDPEPKSDRDTPPPPPKPGQTVLTGLTLQQAQQKLRDLQQHGDKVRIDLTWRLS